MNSAALLKQERQDDFRRATHTVVRRVEKCIEIDGGILNTSFELLQFIEIIYITNAINKLFVFIPVIRRMHNIQTAVSPHSLKIGHILI
jgi:hypothetical protein